MIGDAALLIRCVILKKWGQLSLN